MLHNSNMKNLIKKYEDMLTNNELYFFDVDQFEDIAEHYFYAGNHKGAIEVLDMAQNQHPNTSTFMLKRAQFLVGMNKLEEAAKELEVVEAFDPHNEDLFIARAQLFSKKGHHGSAIRVLKQALENSADPFEIYSMLATEYQSSNKLEAAIKHYKLALEIYPEDEIAIYNIAL
jgi:predicted Zn-dependent protease